MSSWLIAAVGLVYAGVAVDQWLRGDHPMAIVYAGYAFSNIGLMVIAART
jgi:hypothetical protein